MSLNIDCIRWSAFIFGRTYYRDYPTYPLIVPEDFSQEKETWVYSHVEETISTLVNQHYNFNQGLLQRLFLSDDEHYIFGILCNLEKFLTEDDRQELVKKYFQNLNNERAKKLTVDDQGRKIPYIFLAYVIKKKDILDLPPIRFELNIFKPLCEYFYQNKWFDEKTSQIILSYQEESFEHFINLEANTYNLPKLNYDSKKLALHPGVELDAQKLWTAASLCKKNQTLWIGQMPQSSKQIESIKISSYPEEKTILQSKFLNISLPNIDNHILVSKQMDSSALAPKKLESESSEGDDNQGGNLFTSGVKFVKGEIDKLDKALSYLSPSYNMEQSDFEEIKQRSTKILNKITEIESDYSRQVSEFTNKIKSLKQEMSELKKDISEIANQYQDDNYFD